MTNSAAGTGEYEDQVWFNGTTEGICDLHVTNA